MSKRSIGFGVAMVALLVGAHGALAQVLTEEIVVTAQKREQNLQDVGLAVTAFSGSQMKELGFASSTDLVALTPGMQLVSPNGGSSNFFTVRGVTQNDFTDHQESPVATYVDEVYASQMAGTSFMLFDMERAEVLRGPQGTLFGRNATGGLVHFLTKKPTQAFDAYATLSYGSYDQVKAEGAIGGGMSEKLALRLSASAGRHDGWMKNRIGKDLNTGKDSSARLQALITPNDDLDILLNLRGAKQNIRAGAYSHAASYLGPDGLGLFVPADANPWGTCNGCDMLGYVDNDGDPYTGDYDKIGHNKLDMWGTTANIKWRVGDIDITSITDFSHLKKDYIEDSDASPNPMMNFSLTSDVNQFSQELRLNGSGDRYRWVAGLYYLQIKGDYSSGLELPLDGVRLYNPWDLNTKSYAAFGQAEYDVTDKVTLIGGFRWTEERKRIHYTSSAYDFATGDDLGLILDFGPATTPLAKQSKGDWSGRLQLDYHASDDVLVYASWNRGLKSGGFNAPLDISGIFDAQGDPDLPRMVFDSEVLYAYEVGVKATLLDGRGRFNAAAFYYDYKGYQAFDFQGLTQFVFNTDATIKGADAELVLTPVKGLDLMVGLSLLDATAKDIPLPDGSSRSRDIVLAPDVTVNGLVRYGWDLAGGTAAVQLDGKYLSSHYFNVSNAPTTHEKGYGVLNARVSFASGDDRWSVAGFVKNLTRTNYRVIAFDVSSLGLTENYPGMPRWFGVELTYRLK